MVYALPSCSLPELLESIPQAKKLPTNKVAAAPIAFLPWNNNDSVTTRRCEENAVLCLYDLYPDCFLHCDPAALTTLGRTASRAQRGPAPCAWGRGSTEGWTGWGNWLSGTAESRRSTTHTRIMLEVSPAPTLLYTAVCRDIQINKVLWVLRF